MDSGKPTFGFWKMRGFGQQIRHLLAYCKVDYEQTLFDQGPAPDFVEDEWQSVKGTYGFDFPNLPFFIDGEFKMTYLIYKYIDSNFNSISIQLHHFCLAFAHMRATVLLLFYSEMMHPFLSRVRIESAAPKEMCGGLI